MSISSPALAAAIAAQGVAYCLPGPTCSVLACALEQKIATRHNPARKNRSRVFKAAPPIETVRISRPGRSSGPLRTHQHRYCLSGKPTDPWSKRRTGVVTAQADALFTPGGASRILNSRSSIRPNLLAGARLFVRWFCPCVRSQGSLFDEDPHLHQSLSQRRQT